MDFKVAGTREGITAIQMDVKVGGIPHEILAGALAHAKAARLQILDVIESCLAKPRPHISLRAPEIIALSIKPEQIGLVIGGGGKTINKIKTESGVIDITIEDTGEVYITGSQGTAQVAANAIRSLTKQYQVGERLTATITRVVAFGAFAQLDAHHEGFIHISEVAPWRLESVADILKEGDQVPLVVSKVEDGKIGLSIKQANPTFATDKGLLPPDETV